MRLVLKDVKFVTLKENAMLVSWNIKCFRPKIKTLNVLKNVLLVMEKLILDYALNVVLINVINVMEKLTNTVIIAKVDTI